MGVYVRNLGRRIDEFADFDEITEFDDYVVDANDEIVQDDCMVDVRWGNDDQAKLEDNNDENNNIVIKSYKKKSAMWECFHEELFVIETENKYVVCKFCKKAKFKVQKTRSTSHLKRHMDACFARRMAFRQQVLESRQTLFSFQLTDSVSLESLSRPPLLRMKGKYEHNKVFLVNFFG